MKEVKKLLFVIMFLNVFSCKKYDENPLVNLRSRQHRMTSGGDYQIASYFINDYDSTEMMKSQLFLTHPYGGYIAFHMVDHKKIISGSTFGGEWDFHENKKYLRINLSNDSMYPIGPFLTKETLDWEITKLTERELHLKVDFKGKRCMIYLYKKKFN